MNQYSLDYDIQFHQITLTLGDVLDIDISYLIDAQMLKILETMRTPVSIVIDARLLKTIVDFAAIREIFTHQKRSSQIKEIMVITENKILKLSFLVIYSLSYLRIKFLTDAIKT